MHSRNFLQDLLEVDFCTSTIISLPTTNAIAQALLGTVVSTTLHNNPLMVEVFICVDNLLLNDHVAAGFVFYDVMWKI
jgi:hypothetical protein